MGYAIVLAWAFVVFLIQRQVRRWLRERHYAREAHRLGCEPPLRQPNRLPFGLDHIREAVASDKSRTFPQYAVRRFARLATATHEYSLLGTRGILTADPKNIQAILATQFKDFSFGSYRIGTLHPLLGNGIFAADGVQWERARAMMRPQFVRDQVSDLELEEEHVGNLMCALPMTPATGWTDEVDLQVLFFRLTLDSACQFLFGESVDSQLLGLPENESTKSLKAAQGANEVVFAKAFDGAQSFTASRSRMQDLYFLMDSFGFRRDVSMVHQFVDYFVQRALRRRQEMAAGAKGSTAEKGGRYVFLDALAAETQDPIELRYQLVNILLAGRDTTAGMLGWAFYTLARRPDLWERLRAAILKDFGTYENSAEISFVTLKNCTFLHHFINEVLRLYPVVPVNTRRSVKATTIPSGGGPDEKSPIFVPPDTNVDYSVHVMHRLKRYWGEDAEEFNPDRWITRRPGWEYLPWNGGPRICLGLTSLLCQTL